MTITIENLIGKDVKIWILDGMKFEGKLLDAGAIFYVIKDQKDKKERLIFVNHITNMEMSDERKENNISGKNC
jgi:hypothetical protein